MFSGRLSWGDVSVVAVVLPLVVVDEWAAAADAGGWNLPGLGALVSAALTLLWRRRLPRMVLAVVVGLLLVYAGSAAPSLVTSVPALVALYAATRSGHRRFAALLVVPVLVGTIVVSFVEGSGGSARDLVAQALLPAGWFVAAGVLGEVFRQYAAYVDQVRGREIEALRTREEAAARRAGQERLRIARELHDSLTHAISVIKLQVGVAVHLADKRGEPVPESLVAIQESANEANRELRATLRVLRSETVDAGGSGVEELPSLIERSRAAGLEVDYVARGDLSGLPVTLGHVLYRVVQESLTNTVKHAPGSRVHVEVVVDGDGVRVSVADDGRGAVSPTAGVGLTGMRERVEALGGLIEVGSSPAGGFEVRARLPQVAV